MSTNMNGLRIPKQEGFPGEIRICNKCGFSKYYGAYQKSVCPICTAYTAPLSHTQRIEK